MLKGFEVIEAANGLEGIELARKELPDLILCDINMGKVDGYLTLSSLRNEAPTAAIPFILMTGLADNAGMSGTAWNWARMITCPSRSQPRGFTPPWMRGSKRRKPSVTRLNANSPICATTSV